ncbi:MAG: DUF2817 domain-containing protein [Lysobacterales bacterium]
MHNVSDAFSDNYDEARAKFLTTAAAAGAQVKSALHPLTGPDGQELHMDFATLGPEDAENAVIVVSGTHGPEAFCGSGVQVQLLSSPQELDALEDTRLVFVHGHNPHGWAWLRRVNEDNIDINRNYCDFDEPYPSNEEYETVRELLLPEDFDDSARQAILDWIAENGAQKFATVALAGQRIDPQGIFYGGHKPVWSRRTMWEHLPPLVAGQKRAMLLDFHTGVGEFGEGTILHLYGKSSSEHELFQRWYDNTVAGDMEEMNNDEIDHQRGGALMSGVSRLLPDQESLALVVEYGTVGIQRVLFALIMDNWLHAKGVLDSDKGREIKQEMLDALYGNTPQWHSSVWEHGCWLIQKTAAGLRGS